MKHVAFLLLSLLLATLTFAQTNDSLVVLFLSEPGVRPAGLFGTTGSVDVPSRYDATGDDIPDLVMQRDNDSGNLQNMRVLDARTLDSVWEAPNVLLQLGYNAASLDTLWRFHGFADPLNTGTPQAVLVSDVDVVLVDMQTTSVAWAWSEQQTGRVRLLNVLDLDGDRAEELILSLPDTRQLQVIGLPGGGGRTRGDR